jgi:hypothetical protein
MQKMYNASYSKNRHVLKPGRWTSMDDGRPWTMDVHGRWTSMDDGRPWTMDDGRWFQGFIGRWTMDVHRPGFST